MPSNSDWQRKKLWPMALPGPQTSVKEWSKTSNKILKSQDLTYFWGPGSGGMEAVLTLVLWTSGCRHPRASCAWYARRPHMGCGHSGCGQPGHLVQLAKKQARETILLQDSPRLSNYPYLEPYGPYFVVLSI